MNQQYLLFYFALQWAVVASGAEFSGLLVMNAVPKTGSTMMRFVPLAQQSVKSNSKLSSYILQRPDYLVDSRKEYHFLPRIANDGKTELQRPGLMLNILPHKETHHTFFIL